MVKIHRLKGDITPKIASSFKGSIAIDTEATGLKIPERDKLSLENKLVKLSSGPHTTLGLIITVFLKFIRDFSSPANLDL